MKWLLNLALCLLLVGIAEAQTARPARTIGDADRVIFTPSGNLEATDVDGAIQELDTEKAPLVSPTFTGASRISGTLESDAVSPSQISGNQDDYAGCAGKVVCRLDTDGGHTITSFAGGGNWRWLFVVNIGSNEFILDHDAATGTAANRINSTTGADITVSPGEAALLVYDNTTSRWRATKFGVVVASEADTLDTVFDRGKVIDGASSFANAARFTDSSGDGIAIYRDATNGPVVTCIVSTVENDCDKVVKLNANKVWKITDDADGTIVQVSEAGVTTYGSSYRPRKSIWFGADALYGDGTQCPAAPTAVTINSGPIVPTFICADNDGSSLYGSIKMPDSWDGGTVTFTHVYLQTAADTNAINGDIACQARSNGEAPSSTWGTEVAIDDAGVTGSNQNDMTTSAAATCAGTGVAGGDVLYFRYQLDAAGTTTAVATLHHVGFMMEYSASGLSD